MKWYYTRKSYHGMPRPQARERYFRGYIREYAVGLW